MTTVVKKNISEGAEGAEKQRSLLSLDKKENEIIADEIQDLKLHLSGDKMESGFLVPRYGLLSLKMRNTPIYAYDHPALMKVSNTAFTDGVHIFIAADFMRQLMKEEEEKKHMEQGCVPLIQHELMHMLMNHTRRLGQFPPKIRNQATDLSINAKLQLGFPEIKWVSSLREVGFAFNSGEPERYAKLAEETIARELIEKQKDEKNKDNKKGNGKGGGSGKQQSGGGKPQSGQGGKPQQGQGQPEQGEGDQDQNDGDQEEQDDSWDNNHTIGLDEFVDILNENGLDDILEKLELPKSSDDLEQIAKIEEQVRLKDIDAIQKAAAQKAQMNGKYPGAHIVDSCAELVKGFTEGKLQWRLGLKNFMFGEGMRFRYTEMEPGDIYYVDPREMGLNTELFVGSDLPHRPEEVVLCLIDTSGSVDQGQLKGFFSEIFNLKMENSGIGDSASEIIVLYADTVLRGAVVEINESNVDQMMEEGIGVNGRGGTDLSNDLRMAMKLPILRDKKVSSVCFFTDLCDTPPKKSDFQTDDLPPNMPLCFITMPHTHSEEFARQVKDFARVYAIEEGTEVVLDDSWKETAIQTRAKRKV